MHTYINTCIQRDESVRSMIYGDEEDDDEDGEDNDNDWVFVPDGQEENDVSSAVCMHVCMYVCMYIYIYYSCVILIQVTNRHELI